MKFDNNLDKRVLKNVIFLLFVHNWASIAYIFFIFRECGRAEKIQKLIPLFTLIWNNAPPPMRQNEVKLEKKNQRY